MLTRTPVCVSALVTLVVISACIPAGNTGLDGGADAGGGAHYAVRQYTTMTYPGYDGNLGSYSCPPSSDTKYQPQPVNLYVPELTAGGSVPLLLFFPGTGDDISLSLLTSGLPNAVVQRAAQLGFAAAAVAYRSLDFNLFYPDRMDAKENCIFGPSPTSIINQLCGNQEPLVTSATKIDCSKGMVVVGHSQGGLMAMMAKNYDPRVLAAYVLGTGIFYDPSSACSTNVACGFVTALFPHVADPSVVLAQKGSLDSFVMGSSNRRVLASNSIRLVAGDVDPYFHLPYAAGATTVAEVASRLNNIVNLTCGPGSPAACSSAAQDGSGWFIVGDSQLTPCTASTACTALPPSSHSGHCFFSSGNSVGCVNSASLNEAWDPDPNYFGLGLTAGWTLDASLNWLKSRLP